MRPEFVDRFVVVDFVVVDFVVDVDFFFGDALAFVLVVVDFADVVVPLLPLEPLLDVVRAFDDEPPIDAELLLDERDVDFELPPERLRFDLSFPIGSALPTAFTAPPAASPTVPAILPAVRPTVLTTFPGSGIGCPPSVRLLTGRSSPSMQGACRVGCRRIRVMARSVQDARPTTTPI